VKTIGSVVLYTDLGGSVKTIGSVVLYTDLGGSVASQSQIRDRLVPKKQIWEGPLLHSRRLGTGCVPRSRFGRVRCFTVAD